MIPSPETRNRAAGKGRRSLGSTVAATLMCAAVTRAQVELVREGTSWHVRTPNYEAVVEKDGCLTSFRVRGEEFFSTAARNPRGAYLYQKGPLVLSPPRPVGNHTLVADSSKATVRYEFRDSAVTWYVVNKTAAKLLCLIVFSPRVKVVRGEADWWEKVPTTFRWKETTWFCDRSNLRIRGSSRVWGPWRAGLQVWEATVAPNQPHEVTLQPDVAPAKDTAQAERVAGRPPPPPPLDPVGPMWDLERLSRPPRTFPAEGFHEDGVEALFYAGPVFRGKPTRVFAWVGLPNVAAGRQVPGMVLVHGGGGSAFASWVRRWTKRGYAAIAMDTCGCVPKGTYGNWERHPQGGPPGWGGWGQIDWPREDQWTYHAVADIILAHSLLRSLPRVDARRIGLTGISWGGYLTCIVAGVDHRFKFAVPVYGCGFTNENAFAAPLNALGKERAARWMRWWDPSGYLPQARLPMLWVGGTNDFAYTFNALQKSYRLPPGPRTLCIRLRMPHGQEPGESPREIQVFADSLVKGGTPLPTVTGRGREGDTVWATFRSREPVVSAELNYTVDTGAWQDREWQTRPARIHRPGRVMTTLPPHTAACYFNLVDDRGCIVSTEHEELRR